MIKSLVVVAFRSLRKRRFYSILNVTGLAVSIAFTFLLWIYIKDQSSYDRHLRNAKRIYRVNADLDMNGKRDIYSNGPRPVAPLFKAEFPEVVDAARLRGVHGLEIHTTAFQVGEKKVQSRDVFVADSTVFNIFEREFIHGNPVHALAHPNSIVLCESLARRIFGSSDV